MANPAIAARQARVWAGTCAGEVPSTPYSRRPGAAMSKKPSLHGRFLCCETPAGRYLASDLLLQQRLSSSTGKLSKPDFYGTERAQQTLPRFLPARAEPRWACLRPVRFFHRRSNSLLLWKLRKLPLKFPQSFEHWTRRKDLGGTGLVKEEWHENLT